MYQKKSKKKKQNFQYYKTEQKNNSTIFRSGMEVYYVVRKCKTNNLFEKKEIKLTFLVVF